ACAWGLRDALHEWSQPARLLEFGPGLAGASLDGRPPASAVLCWRGPPAFLHWRDDAGQGGRLVWWPDNLPVAERRALKVNAAFIRPLRGHLLPRAGAGAGMAP